MNITRMEQRTKQFPQINIVQTNFAILIFQMRLAPISIIKRTVIIWCALRGWMRRDVKKAPHLDSELLHRSRPRSLWPRCRVCWSEYISSFRCTVCGWEDIWPQLDVCLQKKKRVLSMLIVRMSTFVQWNYQVQRSIHSDRLKSRGQTYKRLSSFQSFAVFTGKQLHPLLLLLLGDLVCRRWENL